MLRFAMISKWHVHAKGYAEFVQKQPDACITCEWDEAAARGAAWAESLGVDFVADYDALLAREDVDAILVCTPTNMHKEVMIKAANAVKHIFTCSDNSGNILFDLVHCKCTHGANNSSTTSHIGFTMFHTCTRFQIKTARIIAEALANNTYRSITCIIAVFIPMISHYD